MTRTLENFNEIVDQYDVFFIDIWGTLHDGVNLLPGAKKQLELLKSKGKTILLLSNTPRPQEPIRALNNDLGLSETLYDHLLTSGDLFLEAVKTTPRFQKPYYFIGTPGLHDVIKERLEPYPAVPTIQDAHYLLCTSVQSNHEQVLKEALSFGIPFVCTNPDLTVMENGTPVVCPGSLAQDYQKMGGEVFYYGKPHKRIYDRAIQKVSTLPKDRILMVGDGLYTDILGANTYGLDCLLVNSGVHRNKLASQDWTQVDKICADLHISPTYRLSAFE